MSDHGRRCLVAICWLLLSFVNPCGAQLDEDDQELLDPEEAGAKSLNSYELRSMPSLFYQHRYVALSSTTMSTTQGVVATVQLESVMPAASFVALFPTNAEIRLPVATFTAMFGSVYTGMQLDYSPSIATPLSVSAGAGYYELQDGSGTAIKRDAFVDLATSVYVCAASS